MEYGRLKSHWLREERIAHVHGWDFSHLHGRYREDLGLTWNYEEIVRRYLRANAKLLDMETGGGEFLLSLGHPYQNTGATEGYPPNVALCKSVLLPLGVDFRESGNVSSLPFPDCSFDIVTNRHGDFDARELLRVLRPGGLFITQQVGAQNDRELVELLLPGTAQPYPNHDLQNTREAFVRAGFEILDA